MGNRGLTSDDCKRLKPRVAEMGVAAGGQKTRAKGYSVWFCTRKRESFSSQGDAVFPALPRFFPPATSNRGSLWPPGGCCETRSRRGAIGHPPQAFPRMTEVSQLGEVGCRHPKGLVVRCSVRRHNAVPLEISLQRIRGPCGLRCDFRKQTWRGLADGPNDGSSIHCDEIGG